MSSMRHPRKRRTILAALLVGTTMLVVGCGPGATPDEQELARLQKELRSVEEEISGMKRVSAKTGEAPPGELVGLESQRDELVAQIAEVERRISEAGTEE